MKTLKATRILIYSFGVLLLAGFTGKYVELEGLLNGRSSATFGRNDNNILTTLPKGTRGEILKSRTFNSGNHGLKIQVLEGPHAGNVYWVYHKKQNSRVALYNEIPKDWKTSASSLRTKDLETAKAAETLADVPSVQDTPAQHDLAEQSESAAQGVESPSGMERSLRPQPRPTDMTRIIERANKKVQETKPCSECSTAAPSVGRNPIGPAGSRKLSSRCDILMNANGDMGSLGQHMFSSMGSSKYTSHFTKSNALGPLCPNFNQLSTEQKLHAWVFMWTSLAQEESGCNINVHHPTHSGGKRLNPTEGHGLWAAEKSASFRRYRTGCSDISNGKGQANCAIGTMFDTALKRGHTATSRRDGYWGPLRRAKSQMIPHMRRYKACF